MMKKVSRIAGSMGLAAALLLGGGAAASAADQVQTWTLTACTYQSNGHTSYTYTAASGDQITSAAYIGDSFTGNEWDFGAAVAEAWSEMVE